MPEATSVYFSSLRLTNVRCFGGPQRLRLTTKRQPARWSLIIGENGAGKTTLLECLAWMRPVPEVDEPPAEGPRRRRRHPGGQYQSSLEGEENDVVETLSRNESRRLYLGANLSVGLGKTSFATIEHNTGQSTRELHLAVRMQFDDRSGLRGLTSTGTTLDSLGADLREPLFVTYGANRYLGHRNSVAGHDLDPWDHKRLSQSTELYDMEELLMRLDYAATSQPEGPEKSHLAKLKKVIATILFDDQDESRIRIYPPDVLDIGRRGGVYVQTFTGLVRMSALSLGYRTTAGWVMDLAWRFLNKYPNSLDPLAEPAVVLIDEIDLHLHPRWQLSIMSDLTSLFPATQFIATSHSPLIVQVAEQANLILLRRQEHNIEIINNPAFSRQYRVDQILTSLLFSIPNTRPQNVHNLLRRRAELVDKAERTPGEEKILNEIQQEIDHLPTAEYSADQAAMDLIRRFATYIPQIEAHEQ